MNAEQAKKLAAWLKDDCENVISSRPVKLYFGTRTPQLLFGAVYTTPVEGIFGGEKIYVIGQMDHDRMVFVYDDTYQGFGPNQQGVNSKEWSVRMYYEYGQPQFAAYHPFGVNFIMGTHTDDQLTVGYPRNPLLIEDL